MSQPQNMAIEPKCGFDFAQPPFKIASIRLKVAPRLKKKKAA
jgi:hypothetical protein